MDIFDQDSVASIPSLARAIIVENVDPDKRGRVKVSYPWLKDGSDTISHWSRVALPFASKGAGMSFIPEVGDEVIVMFEDGDIETPIVIASLYSEKNPPPTSGRSGDSNQDEKNTVRYIKTKSGHMLCFDDSDDKSAIVLKDKDDRKIELNSTDKKLELSDASGNNIVMDAAGKKISITDGSSNKIELDGSGNKIVLSDTNGNIAELSSGGIEIKGSGGDTISIKQGAITIDSTAEIKLGKGAASQLVKGTEFMTMFNVHSHIAPLTGPTSPPMVPMTAAELSLKVKTE